MARFSQRMGFNSVRDALQTDSMDENLRNSLWNALLTHYWYEVSPGAGVSEERNSPAYVRAHAIWSDYFKRRIDTLPRLWALVQSKVSDYFEKCAWYEVYDFVEFIVNSVPFPGRDNLIRQCNETLEREMSGYRFVGTLIAPVTSEQEISAIEYALANTEASKLLNPVNIHLKQALASLSDRQEPDFRNSMKESISAIEALCKLVSGDTGATLGKALDTVERQGRVPIHGSLKKAFQAIYGYTNDASGIRHALKDEPNVDLADATFMLITCSAFINYLLEKARKAGITL